MQWRLAQITVLAAAWVVANHPFLYSQESDAPCPTSSAWDEETAGPEITIVEVSFSGSLQLPSSDREQIADSIKEKTSGTSLDRVVEEGVERARAEWQNHGYFKVEANGEAKSITSNPVTQRIALRVHVNEGERYSLSRISFKHNKAVSDVALLRSLFPIKDGDVLSREKIAIGLENLQKVYGEIGYINFTSIPATKFDDANQLATIELDFDEGKQFRLGSVRVLGLEQSDQEELLKSLAVKPGQILTSKLWEAILLRMPPACDCANHEQLREDKDSGLVTLTLDFRPCPTN